MNFHKKLLKYSLGFPLITVLTFFMVPSLPVSSAEFYSNDTVTIQSTQDNVYATGENIEVSQSVQGDLFLAGTDIEVNGNVGSSVTAAGSKIYIGPKEIDSENARSSQFVITSNALRLMGDEVNIEFTSVGKEVLIFASTVTLDNVNIQDDLYIYAQKIEITNSNIAGDANLYYQQLEGSQEDLESQVRGDLNINKSENVDFTGAEQVFLGLYIFLKIGTVLSTIVFLIIVSIYLGKKGKLHLPSVKINTDFSWSIITGIVTILATFALLIISFFLGLSQLFVPISILIWMLGILATFYTPIYITNLIKNTFGVEMKTSNLLVIVYVSIVILSLIPYLGWIVSVLMFALNLGSFGFILKNAALGVNKLVSTNIMTEKEVENTDQDKKDNSKIEQSKKEEKKAIKKNSKKD